MTVRGVVTGIVVSAVLFTAAMPGRAVADDCKKAQQAFAKLDGKLTDPNEVRYAYSQIVELCPSHAKARMRLANALVVLTDALAHDPDDYQHLLDEAVLHYEKVITYDKGLVAAYEALARLYYLQGRWEMALDVYEKLLRIRPNDSTFQARLEEIRKKQAQEKKGRKTSVEIVGRFKGTAGGDQGMVTMGFKEDTVRKSPTREKFDNILFEEWSSALKGTESIDQLKEIGKALQSGEMKTVRLVVEGHTDNRGDPQRNEQLSQQRAQAVKEYLVNHFQVNASRITSQGFGLARPRVPNNTIDQRHQNRRVEIVFFPTGE